MEKIIMAGAVFNIDRREQRFVRSIDPEVVVPFKGFERDGNLMKVNLHDSGKYLVSDDYGKQFPRAVKTVFVPSEILMEDFSGGLIYASEFNLTSYLNNWNALAFDHKIVNRLKGVLPTVDLAGNKYFVDIENGQLRSIGKKANSIPLYSKLRPRKEDLKEIWCEQGRSFYYDVANWREVDLDFRATQLPENIYLISLPHPRILDPIGVSENYLQEPTALLHEHPVYENHRAISIPLSETSFPEVIRRNQIEKESQGGETKVQPGKRSFFRRRKRE